MLGLYALTERIEESSVARRILSGAVGGAGAGFLVTTTKLS